MDRYTFLFLSLSMYLYIYIYIYTYIYIYSRGSRQSAYPHLKKGCHGPQVVSIHSLSQLI